MFIFSSSHILEPGAAVLRSKPVWPPRRATQAIECASFLCGGRPRQKMSRHVDPASTHSSPFQETVVMRSQAMAVPKGVAIMSRLRVNAFSISIDGYGAGPDQGLENPLGVG